jgi:hypothetical protein
MKCILELRKDEKLLTEYIFHLRTNKEQQIKDVSIINEVCLVLNTKYLKENLFLLKLLKIPTESIQQSMNQSSTTQVERYGPYTAVYDYFTDRITAVLSGTEIQLYHNKITARIRPYTVKMRPRIRCRITVPKITGKYGPFTAPYEANLR